MLCTAAIFGRLADTLSPAAASVEVVELQQSSLDEACRSVLTTVSGPFALVGFSLGGIVAMAAAARAPRRVTHLGLLATNPTGPRPEQRAQWTAWRHLVSRGGYDKVIEQATAAMLLPSATEAERELAYDMARRTGPHVLDRQLQLQASRIDLTGALSQIRAPTAVVAGADDPLCSVELHKSIAANIAGSHLTVLDGCGHLIPIERPSRTAHVLRSLLDRPAAAAEDG